MKLWVAGSQCLNDSSVIGESDLSSNFLQHFITSYCRWLSCYKLAVDTLRMSDPLRVFYLGFLQPSEKQLYSSIKMGIFRKKHLSAEAR